MAISSKIKFHLDVVDNFKELPFYKKPIKKPKVKRLKNIDQFAELPFYEQLNLIKTNQVFRGYAMPYKVEIIEKKIQLYNEKQVNQVLTVCLVIF